MAPDSSRCILTDLWRQLRDGVLGDLEHGELGEQSQVVGQLADLCPPDVPLLQVAHPLQLPGEVLQSVAIRYQQSGMRHAKLFTYRPLISVQLEDQFVLIRILLVLLVLIRLLVP